MRNTIDTESALNRLDRQCEKLVFKAYNEAIDLQKQVHLLKEEINRITNENKYSTYRFRDELDRLDSLSDELRNRLN